MVDFYLRKTKKKKNGTILTVSLYILNCMLDKKKKLLNSKKTKVWGRVIISIDFPKSRKIQRLRGEKRAESFRKKKTTVLSQL